MVTVCVTSLDYSEIVKYNLDGVQPQDSAIGITITVRNDK